MFCCNRPARLGIVKWDIKPFAGQGLPIFGAAIFGVVTEALNRRACAAAEAGSGDGKAPDAGAAPTLM